MNVRGINIPFSYNDKSRSCRDYFYLINAYLKVALKFNIQKTKIMASGPTTSWQIDVGKQCQTLFTWAPKSLQMVIAAMKSKDAYSLEGKLQPT